MNVRPVTAALLVSLICPPAMAASDDERLRAGQLFRAGQAAFAQSDYAAAAQSFEQAHALLPSGSTLYNAARAWDQGGEPGLAAADYEEALAQVDLSAAQRKHAQARLQDLQAQLVAVRIEAPSGFSVLTAAGVARPLPATIYVTPDTKQLEIRDGARGTQTLFIKGSAGEKLVQTVAPARVAEPAKVPAVTVVPVAPPARTPAYWGWAGVGIATAAATATTIVGLSFLSQRSEFIDDGKTNKALRDEAVRLGMFTGIGMGLTLAGAGVAVWGFHRNAEPGDMKVSLVLMPQAFSLRGQF